MVALVVTVKLNNGQVVLGKVGPFGKYAKTFANLTQARNAESKTAGAIGVVGRRPFYVLMSS